MCRHDSCWGICAWWSVKPDTSGKHFPQDVLFCPCVCLKIPSPGPTWAPPVRRRRTLGGVRVIHAQQDADTPSQADIALPKDLSLLPACVSLLAACDSFLPACVSYMPAVYGCVSLSGVCWLVMACDDMNVLENMFGLMEAGLNDILTLLMHPKMNS